MKHLIIYDGDQYQLNFGFNRFDDMEPSYPSIGLDLSNSKDNIYIYQRIPMVSW